MTYLPNLIKRIDAFYQEAVIQKLMSTAAPSGEAEDLYQQMVSASKEILNPEVSDTIRILAEMFRKTVEMDDGFNFIYRTIDSIKTDLDPEEPEQVNVETLLNHVEDAISQRASRPDSSAAMRALQQAASDAKRTIAAEDAERRRQQGTEEEPEGTEEISPYEAAMMGDTSGFSGGEEPAEEGFGGEENAKGVFDMSGGVNPEQAREGKGRGYTQFQPHSYKDWAQVYATEKASYEKQMNAPEMMLSTTGRIARHHTGIRNSLKELVGVLDDLQNLTKEAIKIEQQILVETEVAHPAEEKRLGEIKTALREKEHRRLMLKKNIKKFYQGIQLQELQKDKTEAAKNPRQKFLLDQKIALQNLRMSGDRGIGEESKRRKILIDSLTSDPNLSQTLVERQMDNIQKAKETTTKVTAWHRDLALQRAKTKGTKEPVLTREELREEGVRAPKSGLGKGRIHEWNLAATALDGLVIHLTQRLATERSSTKQKVADKLKKAKQDPAVLKPFMDDAAKAATKKDKTALLAAARRLDAKMEEFKSAQPETVQLLISLRSSKFFYTFRDRVQKISEWVKNPGALAPEQQTVFITDAIANGKKLAEYYKNLHIKSLTPGMPARSTGYKPAVEVIENIVNNLSQMVN